MFGKLFSSAKKIETAARSHKRRYSRRNEDKCVIIINGQMHPVENWSSGGILVAADERLFAIDQNCTVTIKFKLREEVMEVDHSAKIIRKTPGKIALEFLPLSKQVQEGFKKVVDDFVAQRFADSQTI